MHAHQTGKRSAASRGRPKPCTFNDLLRVDGRFAGPEIRTAVRLRGLRRVGQSSTVVNVTRNAFTLSTRLGATFCLTLKVALSFSSTPFLPRNVRTV